MEMGENAGVQHTDNNCRRKTQTNYFLDEQKQKKGTYQNNPTTLITSALCARWQRSQQRNFGKLGDKVCNELPLITLLSNINLELLMISKIERPIHPELARQWQYTIYGDYQHPNTNTIICHFYYCCYHLHYYHRTSTLTLPCFLHFNPLFLLFHMCIDRTEKEKFLRSELGLLHRDGKRKDQ